MIVVDTSALMAIVLDEPQAHVCRVALANEPNVLVSAGTVTEALIVAGRRGVSTQMSHLLNNFIFEIVSVTESSARLSAKAYSSWGKGNHRAGLNYGDCFAYALAKERACPLLFVGSDFSQTDIKSVLV